MSPSQLRYLLYGTVLSASLISLTVQATPADGVFGDYFSNIINNSCTSNSVVTGFDTTSSAYGTTKCSTIQSLLGSIFGSTLAPDGQAMIGFYADGSPKYGVVSGGDGTSVGTISAFNLSTCPTGWTLANGSSGTPDLRGEFIRGLDSGRGVDAGRILASTQTDMFKSHTHTVASLVNSEDTWTAQLGGYGNYGGFTTQTASAGGSETRPRNIALLYCMKISG